MLSWLVLCAPASAALPHTVYLMNDDHTDYGWNASVETYEAAMLAELDYYLDQIDATAGNPPAEQSRFNADCWWYLYLYEQHRTPAQFARLLAALRSGHITVPLNPFVELYGALPTEAAIRAGYYPGRLERREAIAFPLAQAIENATIPWGLASLWAGSGVRYSWKGVCECLHLAPYLSRETEVFRWQGQDGQELLMKWYRATDAGSGRSWGGYAEARDNLSPARVQTAIDRFSTRPPFLPFTGLFGAGWDDVSYTTDAFVTLAREWNDSHDADRQVVVSNAIDYFERLEDHRADLPVLRGGWGNDWDLWPAALAARTAQTRRAVEQLRAAEALAAVVHRFDPGFWAPYRAALEQGWNDYFKYFEHTWGSGGVPLATIVGLKKTWANHFDDVVQQATTGAAARFADLLAAPEGEQRFAVFNPLGFARTDYADLAIAPEAGPFAVTDVATGAPVESQVVTFDGARYLRILARDVPSLGYRTYRYASGQPAGAACCTVQPDARRIESDTYRVEVGDRGQLTSVVDRRSGREIAGGELGDFGSGAVSAGAVENAGPVSATLRLDIAGTPPRRVRVTLLRDVDRVEIDDEILANDANLRSYRFAFAIPDPSVHFEEVGAIARPGLVDQGGDFLPGTRARYMTLNHFLDVASGDYHVTLSNWDAFAMRIGDSSDGSFDDGSSTVEVVATGNPNSAGIDDQGGDAYFRYRFGLLGAAGGFSAADAMRASLAHQNPLRAIPLVAGNVGPLDAATAGFLAVDASAAVLMAVKPAEEGDRGVVLRLWELGGMPLTTEVDATPLAPSAAVSTSHIETDIAALPLAGGRTSVDMAANQLVTLRLALGTALPSATAVPPSATPTGSPTPSPAPPSATASPTTTPSPAPPTPSRTPTLSPAPPSATPSPTTTPSPATTSATPTDTIPSRPTTTHTASPGPTSSATAAPSPPATPTTELPSIPGDLDRDGVLTMADLDALVAAIFDPDPLSLADVNLDGRVTAADLPALAQAVASSR